MLPSMRNFAVVLFYPIGATLLVVMQGRRLWEELRMQTIQIDFMVFIFSIGKIILCSPAFSGDGGPKDLHVILPAFPPF